MRFSTAVAVLASAGFAAAQTTLSSAAPKATGACDAQNIVDACVAGIQPQIAACGGNDWICLCQQYTNLLTCYNNCPGSSEGVTVQQQVTSYCGAAAPLISSSLAAAATMPHPTTKKSAAATSEGAAATKSGAAAKSASGTAGAASATSTGVAGVVAAPVGGALALFLGLAGLL